jgi:acetoin utilization protein AcuB
MIVGMWMSRQLIVVQPETGVSDVARLMRDNRIRRLPVAEGTDEDLRLLGIISSTDIYRSLPPGSSLFGEFSVTPESPLRAREIMTSPVLTTTTDTPIEDAATVMRDRKIGALPVVRDGRLIGLVTESDIFRAFISVLKADTVATRVTFSVSPDEDLFELLAKCKRQYKIEVLSLMSSRRDDRVVCVVRIAGPEVQQAVEDFWQSGHQVINVLQC